MSNNFLLFSMVFMSNNFSCLQLVLSLLLQRVALCCFVTCSTCCVLVWPGLILLGRVFSVLVLSCLVLSSLVIVLFVAIGLRVSFFVLSLLVVSFVLHRVCPVSYRIPCGVSVFVLLCFCGCTLFVCVFLCLLSCLVLHVVSYLAFRLTPCPVSCLIYALSWPFA